MMLSQRASVGYTGSSNELMNNSIGRDRHTNGSTSRNPRTDNSNDSIGRNPPTDNSNDSSITFASFNCGRSRANLESWYKEHGYKVDVACIQEPPALLGRFFNDMMVAFCSGNPKVDTTARDYTRAVVLTRKEIVTKKLRQKPDCVAVDITTKDDECLRVISLYADKNLNPGDLCNCLEDLLEDKEFDYILAAGDLNACSSWWCSPPLGDSDERKRRGEIFEECFLRMNLSPVNANKGVPSYCSGGRSSYIDAVLAYGLTVNKPAYALDTSDDHRTLVCEVQCEHGGLKTKCERINYAKVANWDKFVARVVNKTPAFIKMDDATSIEQAAIKLNDVIKNAMLNSCIETNNRKQARERRRGGQIWWNNDLEKKRKALRKREKEMRRMKREGRTHGEEGRVRDQIRAAKRDYFNSIHKVKREFYQQKRSTATFKEVTRSFRTKNIAIEGYKPETIMDRLLDIGEESLYSYPSKYEKQSTDPLGGDVTVDEIRKAVLKFKKGKAPGSDEIAYEFIQVACDIKRWVEKFRILIQRILEFAFYPSCLKDAKLILLPKIGQHNIQEEHKKWRPISLLKSMAKTVEAVIRNRIMKIAVIPSYIHGYVNSRSTVTAIRSLKDEVLEAKGGEKVLVLYDLSAAFDKISQRYIIKTFKKRTNKRWSQLIHSYLVGHTSTLDGVKRTRSLGVPQGSCTGPVCFMLSTIELGELLSTQNVRFKRKVAIYADDIAVCLEANTVEDLIFAIEDTDRIVEAWAERANLQTNKTKNEIFVKDTSLKNTLEEKLIEKGMNDTARILKDTVKWLGVYWGRSWAIHVAHMISKATKTVALCRGFWQKKWGGSIDTAVLIWNQVICPQVAYGVEVYGEILNQKWLINKYEKLQAAFMRAIYGLVRSTPTKLLSWFLSAMTESLWNRAAERCAKRWLHSPETDIGKKERRCLTKWGISMSVDREVKKDLGLCPRNLNIEIDEGKPLIGSFTTKRKAIFFTDGSLSERGYIGARVGCGIVRTTNVEGIVVRPESYHYRGYRLPDHCSIMQAEQCGILEALRWFNSENACRLKEVVINVDSTSAIKVLAKEKGTELTQLIWYEVEKAGRLYDAQITVHWVRGHAGSHANECADIRANLSRMRDSIDLKFVRAPASYTLREVKAFSETRDHEVWKRVSKGLFIAKLGLSLGRKQVKGILKSIRRWGPIDRRKFFELITGHSPTRKFLYNCGLSPVRLCRYCSMEDETVIHLLWCTNRRVEWLRCRLWGSSARIKTEYDNRREKGTLLLKDILLDRRKIQKLRKFLNKFVPEWGMKK